MGGQADVTAMEKEIHRMELRFDQLKRRQEQMIMEMERAILKRDSIAQKYEPKAKKSKKDATTVNVKRQLQGLKNNLRLCTQANADAEQKISDREAGLADLRSTCDQAMEECAGLEHEMLKKRIVGVVGDLRESYSHPQLDPLWEEFSQCGLCHAYVVEMDSYVEQVRGCGQASDLAFFLPLPSLAGTRTLDCVT